MSLTKKTILILGFILWPLIIAIPQFNLNYIPGLLNGKVKYGEIPYQFYMGLISGFFISFIFWGISILISLLITKIRKVETRGSLTYFYITLFFLAGMLITQGKTFYIALTLEEEKVITVREMLKNYKSNESIRNIK